MSDSAFTLILYDLQSPINIGQILRVAETFEVRVAAYDPRGVLADAEKRRTISNFACGALERAGVAAASESGAVQGVPRRGRLIVTVASDTSETGPLSAHRFSPRDRIVIGNEYDGAPEPLMAAADRLLHIPLPNVSTPKPEADSTIDPTRKGFVSADDKPVLSAAMTAGVLCFDAWRRRAARKT